MWFSGGPWAYGMGGFGWLWMAIGVVGFVLFIIAIAYIFGWIFRSGRYEEYHGRSGGYDRAIEELKLRYARGEITHEEYENMKRDIGR